MGKKWTKTFASLALGTTLLLSSVQGASAAKHKVQSGDTLYNLAKRYGTTTTEIMRANHLNSTLIRVGQTLEINSVSQKNTTTASTTTYVVKAGDTLSGIAKKYNTTYSNIMKWNGLNSTLIKVGQKLIVTPTTATTSKATSTIASSPNSNVVSIAQKYIGVPYVFGGASPKGFDCSGFIYYTYKNAGKSITRTSAAGYYSMAKKVSTPSVGDLVFFSNTYKKGISHVGIYIGNGKMISASGNKVSIENITSGYWKSHLTGYGRL